jgi:hypothetical protein
MKRELVIINPETLPREVKKLHASYNPTLGKD